MKRFLAALGEVDFPSDDNEWMLSNDFQKAKQLWISSNNNPENKDYKKASMLISKHFHGTFDKSKMVNFFANKVAEVDEDGWANVSSENVIYGIRKSIFTKYNDATYEEEDADGMEILSFDFYERDEDDEIDFDSITDSLTIQFALIKSIDLKKEITCQSDLDNWEKKNNFSIETCFDFEPNEESATMIDEDGYEYSGYSMNGGIFSVLLGDDGENQTKLLEKIKSSLSYEKIDIDESQQEIFNALANGDFETVKSYFNNNKNVNTAIIPSIDLTKPLAIAFSAAFFPRETFTQTYQSAFDISKILPKDDAISGVKECIYFLIAQGSNTKEKILGQSYLDLSLQIDRDITEFLLSFGFDPDQDDGVLGALCEQGDLDWVKKFLDLGARPDSAPFSTTPLMYAAQGESESSSLSNQMQKVHIEIIDLLISKGANINHVDDGGDTALTNAVRCNHSEIVNYLLEKGADPNGGKTKNSIKPILLARDKNFSELEKLLVQYGAEEVKKEVKKKSSKVSSKEKTAKNSNKGKIKCPDCSKYFTQATINKWGGTCGTCYRKKNPRNYKSSSVSQKSGCDSILDGMDSCSETMDSCFDVAKMLAILIFVIWFFGALLVALFS